MKHTMTRFTSLMLALMMLLSILIVPAAAETTYQDVSENAWYYEAVEYVSSRGWMTGVSSKTFAPNRDVSRALFVTVLARMAGAEVDNSQVVFDDVPAGRYYTGAVAWAHEKGIVEGVGGNKFAPNSSITRQELCTMIQRYVTAMSYQLEEGEPKTFTDEKAISSWAKEGVAKMSAIGLIAGYEDGSFRPRATTTRAHVAQIAMRLDLLLAGQGEEPVPMPAQEFSGAAGDDMTVSVNAPEGALPEQTSMEVRRVTDEAELANIKAKTGSEIYAAADIIFSKDEVKLEPEKDVEVQISLDGLENIEHPTVVHVKDDGSVEYVSAEIISANRAGTEKALRFYSKDFSVYAVTEDPSGGNAFTATVNFYVRTNKASGPSDNDDNWKLINKQIIRSNQIDANKDNDEILIFDPGVPELKSTQAFEGWAQTKNFTDNDDKLSVADMNAKIKADYKDGTLHETVEKSFYAEVYDVVYITYHDQKGTVLETQFEHVDSTRKITKKFIKSYSPFKNDQAFFGWIPAAGIKTDENGKLILGDYPEYTANAASLYYKLYDANNAAATTYEITYEANANNLDVYPYLQKGYWLIYDTNIDGNNTANNFDDATSATYTGPKLYRAGEDTVAPTKPTRTGYTFGGWYTDPSMRTEFTFGSPLTATTTIYAKWTPAETTYTVVFMLQNPTDPATVSDVTDNTYAYYDSVERNWTGTYTTKVKTGDTVSAYTSGTVNDKYLITGNITNSNYYNLGTRTIAKLGSDYFVYSAKNTGESVRVKGDGSTTLNVYYDRKTVTINFRTGGTYSRYYYSDNSYYYYGQYQYFGNDGNGNAVALTLTPTNGTWSTTTSSSGTVIYRVYYNNATFKRKDTGATYSGNVYTYTSSTSDSLDSEKPSITGLYGAPITDDMCPTLPENFEWAFNSDLKSVLPANPTTFEAPNGYTESDKNNITFVLKALYIDSVSRTIHYMTQDPETGVWELWKDEYPGNIYSLIQGNRVGRTYIGYNLRRDSRDASGGFVDREGQASHSIGFTSGASVQMTGQEAWTYYRLNVHNLVFISNNQTVRECSVRYNETLAKYEYTDPASYTAENPGESYIPTSPKAGVYFVGWYTDPAYKTKFDFEHGVMGDEAVTVYAKWEEMRFRAILDFTGGDPDVNPADIHFPGNQATAFRLNYLEQIQSSSIQACARDGYVLMGWYYYDKNGKEHEYDFSMGANEDLADMTYGTQGDGETDEAYAARMNGSTREGSDPFNANAPTWNDTWDTDWETHDYSGEYAAAGYANAEKMREARGKYRVVRGLIMIYAKWRVDPDAVADAKVTYHGDHDEIDTGYFETDGQPHIWIDPKSYGDKSQAYAQAASVPETEGEQFLYWEVLRPVKDEKGEYVKDANGEIVFEPTGEKAYPGQTFEVNLEDAVKTRTYIGGVDPNHEHELEHVEAAAATCTVAGNLEHWRCTICGKCFSDAAGENEVTQDSVTVAALGHDVEGVAWSYSSTGHWQVCKREGCGAHVNGAAHNMVEDMSQHVDPAIGVAGHTYKECSVCGFVEETTLPALTGYTVTYHVPTGLTAPAAQTEVAGTEITLPTMGDSGDYTFLGWVTAEIPTATDTQPTILTDAYTVNANADLYAVYSYTEGSGASGEYELVTSAPADWTGNYVITYGTTSNSIVVLAGITAGTSYESLTPNVGVAFADTGMQLDGSTLTNVGSIYVFEAISNNGKYKLQNKANGNFVSNQQTTLYSLGTFSETYGNWVLSYDATLNCSKLYNDQNGTDTTAKWVYLSKSTSSNYFVMNSESGMTDVPTQLWKETAGTTTYYTTAFDTTPGGTDYTVSFSVPEGVTAIADMTVNSATGAALPTAGAPEGYTFLGWVTDTVDNVAAEPANILTGTYRPTANITLKALYSYTGTIPGGYKLSDSAPAAGETVILAGKNGDTYYALNHTVTGTNGTELSFTNGVVADTTNILWDVTSGTNGIYLRKNGDSGNQRLKLNGSALGYTNLSDQNGSSNTGAMSFTVSGDGFDMYGTYNTGRHLGFSGTTFSVSSAANTIYVFKYVAGVTNGTVYTTEIGGSSAATFTVTYMADGSQYDQTTVVEGESVTLPTGLSAVNGWSFVGWYASDLAETTNNPTPLTGSYTPNGTVTLYAVYTKNVGGSGTSWEKATSIAAGDKVVLVCESKKMELTGFNTTGNNNYGVGTAYTTTIAATRTYDVVELTAEEKSGFGFSNSSSPTYYLYWSSSYSNVLSESTTTNYSNAVWDVSFDASGNAIIKNQYNTDRQIQWNASSPRFACYTSSQTPIQLYKQVSTGGTPHWTSNPSSSGNAVTEPEVEVVRAEKLNEALLTENADRSITDAASETAGLASVTPAPVVTASTTVASWNCDTEDNVSDWSIIDADGDGYNWGVYTSAASYTHDASDGFLISYSYYSSTALTPDNWAVSPAINVPANGTTTLTFWARGMNNSYYAENFEVRALTAAPTSSNYTSGTVVMSKTTTTASWTQYTVDLSSYKGQTIYLEFRHFDTTDMLALGLDDIIITNVVLPKLTINYQYENGTQAAETYVKEYAEGTEYRVVSPTIPGYTCDKPIVSDAMGSSDVTVTVTYTAVEVEEEEWEPTTVIKPGEDYLIAYMINGTPYLLVNYNVSATNHYYYSYTGTSSTFTMGYLAPAVVDSQTSYITGVSGAATNLNYCKWLFETAAGGKITSSYESGRMLYWNNSGVYPNTTGDSWVWTVTDTANNLGTMHNVYTNSSNETNSYYFTTRTSTGSTSYSSGTPYAGIYSTAPASGNIRLYKRHVDEDTTWTVKFVNYNYTSLATEGYPDQTITNNGVVTKPTVDPTRNEDYEFAGWYIIGQDEPYDFTTPVTKDLTLQARYTMVYTYTYNLHLRAVYGMRNTTGKTHIYWYANDGTDAGHGVGAGARFEQNEVDMNIAYSIPYPTTSVTPSQKLTWTSGTWQPGQTQNAPTGLVYLGHTFLGWARVNTTGAGTTGTAHPELTEDDLYLKWDAENNRYLYRQESRDGTVSWTNATAVTDVYADESQPYHDMYAVWSSHVFYVFHSSTGTLQAFEMPMNSAAQGSMIGTFDITKLVPDGYLYGGYYSTYGGVNMDAVKAARGASVGWSEATLVSDKFTELAELTVDKIPNAGFTAYTGESKYLDVNMTQMYWDANAAYNVENLPIGMTAADVNGKTMKPEPDTIYYLKEVPEAYLHTKIQYVYEVENPGDTERIKFVDLYLLSVADDGLYQELGFRTTATTAYTDAMNSETINGYDALTPRFTIVQKPNPNVNDGKPVKKSTTAKDFKGVKGGYVVVRKQSELLSGSNFSVVPTWKTYDGVIIGNDPAVCTIDSTRFEIGVDHPTPETGNKVLYVNVGQYANYWYNDSDTTCTKAYFCGGTEDDKWVTMDRISNTNFFRCVIPAGYTKVIITRCSTGEPQADWSHVYNRGFNITLSSEYNCIKELLIERQAGQVGGDDITAKWTTFVP